MMNEYDPYFPWETSWNDPFYYRDRYENLTSRAKRKKMAPHDVHVPNKNEAKVLRRLMSETGLTEAELRENKKYRTILSEAQKVKAKRTSTQLALYRALKTITRELKLPKEHPATIEAFEKLLLSRPSLKQFHTGNIAKLIKQIK